MILLLECSGIQVIEHERDELLRALREFLESERRRPPDVSHGFEIFLSFVRRNAFDRMSYLMRY